MNKITLLTTLSFTLCLTLIGCDVSDGDYGSSGGNAGGVVPENQNGDAVIIDYPIAYVQRKVPIGFEDDDDLLAEVLPDNFLDPTEFRGGARLVIKNRASLGAASRIITDRIFPALEDPDGGDPIDQDYDVRDLSVSDDGSRILFSMRAPEIPGADDDEQPTWNIWEYDMASDTLTQLIGGVNAELGHDRFPVYLPDDSIVFASTRQRTSRALLTDQGRPQYAYVTEDDDEVYAFTLHRLDTESGQIDQISYGKGHDLYPTVLDDGRILFLRGDDTSAANRDRFSYYTVHPDGSNLSPHYGFHSPAGSQAGDDEIRGALSKPFEMPDGRILIVLKPRTSRVLGGDIYAIDTENYIDVSTPTYANLNNTGPAEVKLSAREVVLEGRSPHGYFNSAYPLFDGTSRLLVSWMPCTVLGYRFNIYVRRIDDPIINADDEITGFNTRFELINNQGELVDRNGALVQANAQGELVPVEIEQDETQNLPCEIGFLENDNLTPSDPAFGIWVYNYQTGTQEPVVVTQNNGLMYTDAVALQPRAQADTILGPGQTELSLDLMNESAGILHIRSIYDFDGEDTTPNGITAMADPLQTAPDSRQARFVRFIEHANMPHEDDYEIDNDLIRGRGNQPGKAIIGYAPVHPDGSVYAKLPANVPFTMEFVDANLRRIANTAYSAPHRNWLNLRPGEVRECNGCHSPNSTAPHGRLDAQPEPANSGALSQAFFPNTLLRSISGEAYGPPQVGETMAEYYARVKLNDPDRDVTTPDPIAAGLEINYQDEWTNPASGATPGAAIRLEYGRPGALGADNLHTLPPVRVAGCLNRWSAVCRIVINYDDHIQPIYEYPRQRNGADVTCINCHSTSNPNGPEGNVQVPAPNLGNLQLDFTPVVSNLDNNMVFLKGYDEFFAADDPLFELDPETGQLRPQLIQLVVNGVPQYQMQQIVDDNGIPLYEARDTLGALECVPLDNMDPNFTLVLDANGAPVPCMELVYYTDADGNFVDENGVLLPEGASPIPIPVLVPNLQGTYLSANAGAGANRNRRFFNNFAAGGAHEGWLTPAEIRLFSEWLDGGSQYYNEIFKALED